MSSQKRISAPKTYFIKRKQSTWVTSVNPGPHNKNALPVNVLLRDILKIALNAKEVKKIVNNNKLLIDGKVRKDYKFPVGFLDVISIPDLKKNFRLIYDSNSRFKPIAIKKSEADLKIVRVKNKIRKAKNYQLTTNDGRCINVKLSDGKKIKVKDSLLIKIPSQEIVKVLPFIKGARAFITGGKHVGSLVDVIDIKENYVKVKIDKEESRTIKDYVFIISKELKLSE